MLRAEIRIVRSRLNRDQTAIEMGRPALEENNPFIFIIYVAISFDKWHSNSCVGETPMKQHTNNSMRRSPESTTLVVDRRAFGFSWPSL
jgi:hypothetical protein